MASGKIWTDGMGTVAIPLPYRLLQQIPHQDPTGEIYRAIVRKIACRRIFASVDKQKLYRAISEYGIEAESLKTVEDLMVYTLFIASCDVKDRPLDFASF